TFGFLRGVHGEPSVRLGGFIFIDSLTSFATLRLAKAPDAIEAIAAFGDYVERAPFDLFGLLLTDNGGAFISDLFISAVRRAGLQHRTIRPSHPWSNGKVEAMNKTLKYQCFAAIAGNVEKWENAVALVDRWMQYYNTTRSHGGHCNRGLPPLPFYDLWQKTPGDEIAKLISLGIIKIDQDWDVRLMGSETAVEGEAAPLPWAFVMDRRTTPTLQAALGLPPPGDPVAQAAGKGSNIILAR
ncbi:MAG: transposase family protein, partial [Planctomycetes bacterium]|nr:transposase family protein [Planctomycetota bacterium]